MEVLCADCLDQAMSAFAARQQLWGAAATRAASVLEKATPEAAPEIEARSRRTRSETPTARSVASRNSKRQPPLESLSAEANQTQSSESEKGGPKYVGHVSIKFPSNRPDVDPEQLHHSMPRAKPDLDQTVLVLQAQQEEPPEESRRSVGSDYPGRRGKLINTL